MRKDIHKLSIHCNSLHMSHKTKQRINEKLKCRLVVSVDYLNNLKFIETVICLNNISMQVVVSWCKWGFQNEQIKQSFYNWIIKYCSYSDYVLAANTWASELHQRIKSSWKTYQKQKKKWISWKTPSPMSNCLLKKQNDIQTSQN